jgi:Lipocalin-like domain
MTAAENLIGTWKMVSWKRQNAATGEQRDALGPEPVGFINYGADGRFYAIVVRRDRARPATLPPSASEKEALFDSMLAYAGTYRLDEEKAVHRVDASWNQSWTGTDQVRFYRLDGDRLFITGAKAPDPYTGEDVIHRIAFERMLPSKAAV